MIKPFITISLLTVFCVNLSAQEAVVAAGNIHQGEATSISWTLGELAIETLAAGDLILTQGMQQSTLTVVTVEEHPFMNLHINAYPNPTADFLNISIENEIPADAVYSIYEMSGRLLAREALEFNNQVISFNSYKSGVYFLRIMVGNQPVKSFKIVKQ